MTTTTTAPQPLLRVQDLHVGFHGKNVVHGVSFTVSAGEVLAVVGESGSGKSVTSLAPLGLLARGAEVSGSATLTGRELIGLRNRELRAVRGAEIALISQDPIASLNPVFTIGFQVMEAVRAHHRKLSRSQARERVLELLRMVEIPEPERRLRQYPHQLSGGQCQRIGIAMALASGPRLIIADEPTTALDVTVQAEVLDVLSRLGREQNLGVVLITHDMGVVADLADRVVVMRQGEVVEQGSTAEIFSAAQQDYTQQLLTAVPRLGQRSAVSTEEQAAPVLAIRDLAVDYGSRLRGRFRAVEGVSLTVGRGQILGVVGESGSGKSTLGKAILGLSPVSQGVIEIDGMDLSALTRAQRREMRCSVGVVFQNPATSLNPRYTAQETISEPLQVIAGLRGTALKQRTAELLEAVGLNDRADYYPHELSGGQRQRVAIARAVALDPALLIADEPTSALDVSVQAQVLDIFRELQQRLGFACLFISHDLAVVDELCDHVAVLKSGRLVESGTREQVLTQPKHHYTQQLLASVPIPDPQIQRARRAARLAAV